MFIGTLNLYDPLLTVDSYCGMGLCFELFFGCSGLSDQHAHSAAGDFDFLHHFVIHLAG